MHGSLASSLGLAGAHASFDHRARGYCGDSARSTVLSRAHRVFAMPSSLSRYATKVYGGGYGSNLLPARNVRRSTHGQRLFLFHARINGRDVKHERARRARRKGDKGKIECYTEGKNEATKLCAPGETFHLSYAILLYNFIRSLFLFNTAYVCTFDSINLCGILYLTVIDF